MDPQLKNATSLYSFKQTLKKQVLQPPKYYTHSDRIFNILLCQLRNGKSQLNSDLRRGHLLESANCSQCMVPETSEHFLFNCSKYNTQRVALMNWLISQPGIYQTNAVNEIDLLHGNTQLSDKENDMFFDAVFKYIHDSMRFS